VSTAAPLDGLDPEVDEFLRLHNRVLLLARRADGSPTGWPMTGLYGDGILQFSTYRKSAKVRIIGADPRVCCLVTAREGVGEHRVLEYVGTAEIDTEARAMPTRAQAPGSAPAPTAIGTVPDEIAGRAQDRLASGKRGLIRVAPLRVGFRS
jgi:hypothetical protein